jgi:hypothetical protein
MYPWRKEYEALILKRGYPSAAAELHGLRRSNVAALNNKKSVAAQCRWMESFLLTSKLLGA